MHGSDETICHLKACVVFKVEGYVEDIAASASTDQDGWQTAMLSE